MYISKQKASRAVPACRLGTHVVWQRVRGVRTGRQGGAALHGHVGQAGTPGWAAALGRLLVIGRLLTGLVLGQLLALQALAVQALTGQHALCHTELARAPLHIGQPRSSACAPSRLPHTLSIAVDSGAGCRRCPASMYSITISRREPFPCIVLLLLAMHKPTR